MLKRTRKKLFTTSQTIVFIIYTIYTRNQQFKQRSTKPDIN